MTRRKQPPPTVAPAPPPLTVDITAGCHGCAVHSRAAGKDTAADGAAVAASPLTVDVAALAGLGHRCGGCRVGQRFCCASFDICATLPEMGRIIGMMPAAGRYRPSLLSANGAPANVFEETDDGLISIDTDDEGLCVFAYEAGGGALRCSLHSAALDLGLSPAAVKPSACTLWPLALGGADDRLLTICEDATDFHCCTDRPRGGGKTIAPALLESIEQLYGRDARRRLALAARSGQRRVAISGRG